MKKTALALAALAWLAAAAAAQPRLAGYFSSDYLQGLGRSSSLYGSFENPAAGLILSGEWTAQFNYLLEVRTGTAWKPEIEQAWAGWVSSEAFRARIGVYLVPFGRYNEANRPFQTLLVAAPFPYGENSPASWRDIGVVAEGRLGFLKYSAYIGNGLAEATSLADGQQFRNNNSDKGWGLRGTFTLSQELEVGGSYYTGKQDSANVRRLILEGADLMWLTKNVRFTAEYSRALIDNPEPFGRGTAWGFYVQMGLNFGQLTPLVAYEKSKTDDPFHGLGWAGPSEPGAGIFLDHDRWALGATYALHTNILLKLEYDIESEAGSDRKDTILRVQAAVHF